METPAIRHALRGKMNSMRLSVALLPAIDPDEALVYLEHIHKQCELIVELIDELAAHDWGDGDGATLVPAPLLEPAVPPYPPHLM